MAISVFPRRILVIVGQLLIASDGTTTSTRRRSWPSTATNTRASTAGPCRHPSQVFRGCTRERVSTVFQGNLTHVGPIDLSRFHGQNSTRFQGATIWYNMPPIPAAPGPITISDIELSMGPHYLSSMLAAVSAHRVLVPVG